MNARSHIEHRWVALPVTVLLLVLGSASADNAARSSGRAAFLGHASGDPPVWRHKTIESIDVGFCTHGIAPALGTVMTVVPADSSLPTIVAHVASSKRDEHDECAALSLDPIRSEQWTRWMPPASNHGTWHQRVMVLAGRSLKAHTIPSAKVDARDLPAGTRKAEDLILAVDSDGDDRIDVVGRYACKSGRRDCEEWRCEEVWVREKRKWHLIEQICGE
jgi:hypothetical protein